MAGLGISKVAQLQFGVSERGGNKDSHENSFAIAVGVRKRATGEGQGKASGAQLELCLSSSTLETNQGLFHQPGGVPHSRIRPTAAPKDQGDRKWLPQIKEHRRCIT